MQEAQTSWVRNSQIKAKEVDHKHKKVLGCSMIILYFRSYKTYNNCCLTVFNLSQKYLGLSSGPPRNWKAGRKRLSWFDRVRRIGYSLLLLFAKTVWIRFQPGFLDKQFGWKSFALVSLRAGSRHRPPHSDSCPCDLGLGLLYILFPQMSRKLSSAGANKMVSFRGHKPK